MDIVQLEAAVVVIDADVSHDPGDVHARHREPGRCIPSERIELSQPTGIGEAEIALEGMAEAQMVSHLVLQDLAVPLEGVQSWRGRCEDEILLVVGKENRGPRRTQIIVEGNPDPPRLQRRPHARLASAPLG